MRSLSFIAFIIAASALCSTAVLGSDGSGSTPRYELIIKDRPDLKRFTIALKSLDTRPLCLEITRWPNDIGHLHFGSVWVRLRSDEGVYAARDENFGRCVGPSCTLHIQPRSVLNGFIGYAEFGNPNKIMKLSRRRLEVDIAPVACHGQ